MYSCKIIEHFQSDADDWTATNDDTINVALSSTRITGQYSLEFDKADTSAADTTASAYRTIASLNLNEEVLLPHDRIMWAIYLSVLTDVADCYVRLGSGSAPQTNYMQWSAADSTLNAGWSLCDVAIGDGTIGGTGWDPDAITRVTVGVTFDAQDKTLADIKWDSLYIVPTRDSVRV